MCNRYKCDYCGRTSRQPMAVYFSWVDGIPFVLCNLTCALDAREAFGEGMVHESNHDLHSPRWNARRAESLQPC